MDQEQKDAAVTGGGVQQPQENSALVTVPNESVRAPRAIVQLPVVPKKINSSLVSFRYYNSFNYDLLPKCENEVHVALGITSANKGEGKSLVACNLAVSLAMGYQKKTVLVDLNVDHPTLHQVFGAPAGPGLLEALMGEDIHVSPTKIPHLSIFAAGTGTSGKNGSSAAKKTSPERNIRPNSMGLGLAQMPAFADVIYSLKQEYEFVIVDMPSINNGRFPILFANRLSGLLVVVDTTKTRRPDIDKMFRQISEQQVLGFIFNRVKDDDN